MGRSDQERAREKNFMDLGCAEARKHAGASSGARTHMNINNHMYNVDPHVSSQFKPTASQWLYDNNLTNSPANGSLAFAVMRRPDWRNAGGKQQFLSFNRSQEKRLVERVNDAYQMIHARGHENAVLGSTALNCNNFLTDQSGSGTKVFPFVTPVLHEQALTVRVHQIPTVSGRALIPPLSVVRGASTRMLPAYSSIKPSSTQLTIFYAGKVNVYDDVSSIKAQKIMLMAAADNSLPPNMDMFRGKSMPMVMPPVPQNADPAELSQIDLPTCQSDQLARDRVGTGILPASIPQAPQAEESSMPGTQSDYLDAEPVVPRALPQARKASLARFLEKRKERMLSKYPYPVEKQFL